MLDRDDGPLGRRRFLWNLGAAAAGLAGCTRGRDESSLAATDTPTDTTEWIPGAPTRAFGESYEADHVTLRVDSVDLFEGFGVVDYCRRDLTDSPVRTATVTGGDQLARIVVSIENTSGEALRVDFRSFMVHADGELIDGDRFLGHAGRMEHPGANDLRDGTFSPVCFEVDGETRPNRFTEEARYFAVGEERTVWLYAIVPGDPSPSGVAVGLERGDLHDATPRFVSPAERTAESESDVWWLVDPPPEGTSSGTDPRSETPSP